MFRHENLGNGGKVSRQIASERTIGLGPSLTTPRSHETSTNSRMNWFSDSSKYIQFEASKYINGKLEGQRIMYLLVGNETKREKGSKKLNNGSLGAAAVVVPVSFVFLKMRGKVFR